MLVLSYVDLENDGFRSVMNEQRNYDRDHGLDEKCFYKSVHFFCAVSSQPV